MTTHSQRFNGSWILAAAIAATTVSFAGAASPSIWNGGGGNNNWNNSANWSSNIPVPSTTYDLQFAGTIQPSTNNNFTAASNFRNLTFNAGAGTFTLAGNSITLNGNITNSSTNLQTISLAIANNGVTTDYNAASGNITVSGAITGNGGLIKDGTGTLTLTSGSNNYKGLTTINAGTLAAQLINGTDLVINGGTLDNRGLTSYIAGTSNSINGGTIQNGTLNSGAPFVANVATGQATVSAVLTTGYSGSNTSLTSNGAGKLTLSNANTFYQDVRINAGTLQISSNANLGMLYPGAAYTSPTPGKFWLNGTLQVSGTMALGGLGTQSNVLARTLNLGSSANTILVDAGCTFTVFGGMNDGYYGGGSGNFVSRDSSGTLTKDGAGTLVISGANQSPGGLIVNAGTLQATVASTTTMTKALVVQGLQLGVTAALSGSSTITISGATTKGLATGQLIVGTGIATGTKIASVSGDTVTLNTPLSGNTDGNGYQIFANAPTTATFSSGASTIIVGSVTNIQVGQAANGPGIPMGTVVTGITGTTVTLNQGTAAANNAAAAYVFGGVNQFVTNTTGMAPGLYSLGNGLNGTINAIQGNVVTDNNINGGNFAIAAQGYSAYDSLGNGSVTVNGGTLDLGGIAHQLGGKLWWPASGGNPERVLQTFSITGGTMQNGTLGALSYTATNSAAATISANLVDGLSAAGVTNVTPLTMNGTGTLTLSGTNTYTGATAINSGRVLVDGSLAAASSVTVANNATLGGAGNGTTTGLINGNVSISSGGTLAPGDNATTTGTLTTAAGATTTLGDGSILAVKIGAGTAADKLVVNGTLNLTSTLTTLALDGTSINGAFTGSSYTIATYAALTPGSYTFATVKLNGTTIDPNHFIAGGQVFKLDYATTGSIKVDLRAQVAASWNLDGTGDWNTGSPNWTGGTAPSYISDSATFGSVITADRTVTLDSNETLGNLTFDKTGASYYVGGAGTLTLQTASGSAALNVLHGNHYLTPAKVEIASNTTLTVATGSSLTIGGVASGLVIDAGQTLTIAKSSVVNVFGTLHATGNEPVVGPDGEAH
ncbi:MAG: autotransporter-associated beta strand repeat-containing protein, partial [Phycisphaerae bacterium]